MLGSAFAQREKIWPFRVVFSAKETLFKCLYAEVGRYFDFRDALVDALDAASGRFNVRLLVPLTPRLGSIDTTRLSSSIRAIVNRG